MNESCAECGKTACACGVVAPSGPNAGNALPPGFAKLLIGAATAVGLGLLAWAGVNWVGRTTEGAIDAAYVRPFAAPNRLIIAAVTKDYSSGALDDGALLLGRRPFGSAVGLAGWYGGKGAPSSTELVEAAVASLHGATYRRLDADPGPCRKDADGARATTTLGEISYGDDRSITLWTCMLEKKGNSYLLAWAAQTSTLDQEKQALQYMMKGAQLVSNDLCSVNVINGGCTPSATKLITSIIADARGR